MGCKPCCSHQNTNRDNTFEFEEEENNKNSSIMKKTSLKNSTEIINNSNDESHMNYLINEENNKKSYKMNYKYYYEIIEKINMYRVKHNVNPLLINNDLNIIAQRYSDKIARENVIELSNNKYNEKELGEIIFTFHENISPEKIITSIYEKESNKYNYNQKNPKPSNFTQIIWKGSEYIGIGCTKTKENNIYTVINFFPSGNIKNEFLLNVFPPMEEDEKSNLSSNSELKILFLEGLLNSNNEFRSMHGASSLTLNPSLTMKANDYATFIVNKDSLQNYDIEYLGEKCGKNICITNNANYNGKEICSIWYNEIKEYNFSNLKKNDMKKVKNFTQLIWKETREVGYGWAQDNKGNICVVAIYFPSGNIKGKYKENVLPNEDE